MPTQRPATSVALALLTNVFVPLALAAQIEVTGATITELQDAMTSGSVTSAQITRDYLARIAAYDQQGPAINAMIWLNPNWLRQK